MSILAILFLVTVSVSPEGNEKVPFEVYAKGYFVKKKISALGGPTYLVLQDKNGYDEVFGVAFVMGGKPKLVEEKLFEGNLILAVIKSGNAVTTYEVEEVRRDKGKLILQYKAKDGAPTSARFSSPLIVSAPRGDYAEVVFVENGKEVGKVPVKKKP